MADEQQEEINDAIQFLGVFNLQVDDVVEAEKDEAEEAIE